MESVSFIHAGDLHLDGAFRGALSRFEPDAAKAADATFVALERLVRAAERERPDFVLLAGNPYDEADRSLKAQFALLDACRRLDELHIPVIIASGSAAPPSSRLTSLEWPAGATFFDEAPQGRTIFRDGRPVAVVQGASLGRESAGDLVRRLRRDPDAACFQIGLLPCPADAAAEDGDACSMDDLITAGLDAWVLGGRARRILSEKPFIAQSGPAQGLSINEKGPCGCWLVKAAPEDGSFACEARFIQLGPAQWESVPVDVSGAASVEDAGLLLEKALADFAATLSPECGILSARLVLEGATALDGALRAPGALERLAQRLGYFARRSRAILVQDIEPHTRPLADAAETLARDDLAGVTARMAEALASDEEKRAEVAETALAPLFANPRLRGLAAMPRDEELARLFDAAARLGLERLEKS